MKTKFAAFLLLATLFGTAAIAHAEDIVPVVDSTPPVIALIGDASVSVAQGEEYADDGAMAQDDTDGDITSNIVVSNAVDTSIVGTYTVLYNVADLAGNAAEEVTRTVEVTAPLTLSGIAITTPAEKLIYTVGESLDITGLVITGTYSDESTDTETITADNITGFDSTAPATEQVLTITLDGQTATYTIDVVEETEGDTSPAIEGDITLPNGCEVTDTEGTVHVVPEENSTSDFLAVCALVAAQEAGYISGFELTDSSFGLYVKSVHDIQPGETEYWALWLNEEFAQCGIGCLPLVEGDVLSFVLTDWMAETESTKIEITVAALEELPYEISLLDTCTVTDTEGTVHVFPEENSTSDFLAVCALVAAQEAGYISGFELVNNPDFGLYVESVNGISPSDTEYWALWLNEEFAQCGIGCLPLVEGDVLSFVLTDWMAETESTKIFLLVSSLVSSPDENEEDSSEETSGGSGGGSGNSDAGTFSVDEAVAYLKSVQGGDGSFGDSELYTDWVAIAYGAAEVSGTAKSNLLSYMNANNNISSLITDNERRAMALLALGENPYSFGGVNYIGAIVGDFDGAQFGDPDLVNDDIFALIPLEKAGYDEDDNAILKAIDFILSKQKTNGSWESSVDITAAAIQALKPFKSVEDVSDALDNAESYIASTQGSDGGWGNISSTSWALQAENALGASWKKNGKGGLDYLAAKQTSANNNGALLPASDTTENVIWATSYAIPAGLSKPWSEILESVSRPKEDSGGSNNKREEEGAPAVIATADTEISPVVLVESEADTVPVIQPLPVLDPTITLTAETENPNEASEETENEDAEIAPETLTAGALNALPLSDSPLSEKLPLVLGSASGIILLYGVAKLFIL